MRALISLISTKRHEIKARVLDTACLADAFAGVSQKSGRADYLCLVSPNFRSQPTKSSRNTSPCQIHSKNALRALKIHALREFELNLWAKFTRQARLLAINQFCGA